MARLSAALLAIVNAITGLMGLGLLGLGIWVAVKRGDSECGRWIRWPAIGAGAAVAAISLAGIVGAVGNGRGARCLLWLYLALVFTLALAAVAAGVAAIVMTNRGVGHAVSGRGFQEYRLGDYSTWLQRQLAKPSTWSSIRSCLVGSRVCDSLSNSTSFDLDLSSIQSGCCKPPVACNLTYVNGTEWDVTKASNLTADSDCTKWGNDDAKLCFDCDSCKAGLLDEIKGQWKSIAIFDAAVLALLIIIFTLGCCVFHHRPDRRRANPPPGFYVKA